MNKEFYLLKKDFSNRSNTRTYLYYCFIALCLASLWGLPQKGYAQTTISGYGNGPHNTFLSGGACPEVSQNASSVASVTIPINAYGISVAVGVTSGDLDGNLECPLSEDYYVYVEGLYLGGYSYPNTYYATFSSTDGAIDIVVTPAGGTNYGNDIADLNFTYTISYFVPIDTDGDGVPDNSDFCPYSAGYGPVNGNGCTDNDADGYFPDVDSSSSNYDSDDTCNQIPSGAGTCDADGDGVLDNLDSCPFSASYGPVNGSGCTDNDADGYYPDADPSSSNYDSDDTCNQIPSGAGTCDADGDGVLDNLDSCPFSAGYGPVNGSGCTDNDADGYYPDADPSSSNYDSDDTCNQIPSGSGFCSPALPCDAECGSFGSN